jgi:hypothetical protein
MSVTLSLFAGAGAQFFDNNGNVLSGGKIYTYQAGTTTPLATYTSNSESAFHTNPIILDSAGRVPSGGEIWLQLGVGYKFVLQTSTNVLIATYDNIPSSAQPPAANDADSIMYEQGYTVTAGNFVVGKIYRIASVGTTDFTLIGATSNAIGTHFIATGVGTGTGTAELSQTVETKLRQTVSVMDFGAVGDGVADDTLAIQAAINSLPASGGEVYVPSGDYLVTTAIRVKANTTLFGDGYGSLIKCPSTAWALTSTDIYGIITVKNDDNVKITGLRVYGTKTQNLTNTPKLIYYENAKNLTVTQNYLENSAFEGIWSGGSGLDSPRFSITNNRFDNIGWPAGTFVGLPAIQTNGYDGIIANNILNNVGTGIGASGAFTVVSNNFIRGIRLDGIGTGDNSEVAVGSGITTIVGNVIEYDADPSLSSRFFGIKLNGSSGLNRQINVVGNTIKIVGMAGAVQGAGIEISTAENVSVSNNTIEIDYQGRGISIDNSVATRTVLINNNAIKFNSEVVASFGVLARCATGSTLNINSSNNFVSGLTVAGGSYAYDYPQQGTMNVTIQGDLMTGGLFRAGDVNVADNSFNNNPIYLKKDYSAITALIHRPQIAMLNLQPALGGSNYVIAAGVLTITGTVASINKNLSRINVDTEGAAATDDLVTIDGGVSGDILILAAADSGRTVVCKDGTGNMSLAGDFSLDNTADRIVLMYEGTTWFELSRSDNGA